jgi:hypothetical protein
MIRRKKWKRQLQKKSKHAKERRSKIGKPND